MVQFLLDTNVLSEPLKSNPNSKVLSRLKRREGAIATASVVWHELVFGMHRLPDSEKRRTIQDYLDRVLAPTVRILPYDVPAAKWHAAERARLATMGRTPPFADGQIAAIAAVNGLVLVSRDAAHYSGFRGLRVQNWFE